MPAETAAIKTGIDPDEFVKNGIVAFNEQWKKLGLSFDFDRYISTSDPEYYKWTMDFLATLQKWQGL